MSIYIAYRRTASKQLPSLIFQQLRGRGYDAFLDTTSKDKGTLDRRTLKEVGAHSHFLLILSPGSLERCANEGDSLRGEIEEAIRIRRNIIPIYDEGFSMEREMQFLPEGLRDQLAGLEVLHYSKAHLDTFIVALGNRLLKQSVYIPPSKPASPAPQVAYAQAAAATQPITPIARPSVQPESKVKAILPPPFDWSLILPGQVTLVERPGDQSYLDKKGEQRIYNVLAFALSQYPVTNAQYALFVAAKGYEQKKWWTEAGWRIREKENWIQPAFWQDKKWNQLDYPVVGISWFEAIAFCKWLNEVAAEPITLPTEQQWQRAAQGDDKRAYPWGNEPPDRYLCNFDENVGRTTPVTRYPDGASPYGTMDMSGNVWEWCLTEYGSGSNDMNGVDVRILRGGAWSSGSPADVRADFRYGNDPITRNVYTGLRLVRPT